MTKQPIDLDRRFAAVSEREDLTIDEPLHAALWRETLTWRELLELPRVVILGEARTGKSTEFEQRARLVRSQGTPAFAVKVEELANGPINFTFDAEEDSLFDRWLSSQEKAYFFIDSVDEARLNNVLLPNALRALERTLRPHVHRAHVLVSCRVSDWRPREDAEVMETVLPARSGAALRVFSMAPLDMARVEKLASYLGCPDPHAFRLAAERAHAQTFLERPGDVEWMVSYWLENDRFGTLTELIEADIRRKLREDNLQRKPVVDEATARRMTEALGGLAWLERKSSFAVPDSVLDVGRRPKAVEPLELFCDVLPQHVVDVLTRPIFDEASYGRVRLHHRTIHEYLVAAWLANLMERGLSRRHVEELLFRDGPAGTVVPDRWEPIAAWLAGKDAAVRQRLVEVDPSAFLAAGDPTVLTQRQRQDVLAAVVRAYDQRARHFTQWDRAALSRFASVCAAEDIARYLETVTSDELLSALLVIVREGRMSACAAQALRLASTLPSHSARYEAIACVLRVGTEGEKEQLLHELVDVATAVEQGVAYVLVSEGYPDELDLERLCDVIERVEDPGNDSITLLSIALPRVLQRSSSADRVRILATVLDRIVDPHDDHEIRSSWLLRPLAEMVVTMADTLGPSQLEALRPHFSLFSRIARHGRLPPGVDNDHELRALLERNAPLRRLTFWWCVRDARDTDGETIAEYRDLFALEPLWNIGPADIDWLAEDARSQPDVRDRVLAFDCIWSLTLDDSRTELLAQLADGDESLRHRYDEVRTPSPGDLAARARRVQREKDFAQRRARVDDERARERATYEAAIPGIRDGSDLRAISALYWHALTQAPDVATKLANIATHFGTDVAAAVESGMRQMWRQVPCLLPHEASRIDGAQIVASDGLDLDVARGLDLATLDPASALVAARHVAAAARSLPRWAEVFLVAQPGAAAEVFQQCIDAELSMPADNKPFYGFVHHLTHVPLPIRRFCRPFVRDALTKDEPPRLDILKGFLEALIACDAPLDDVRLLAAGRYEAAAGDGRRRRIWWCCWLAADSRPAVAAAEASVAGLKTSAARQLLIVKLFDQLHHLAEGLEEYPFPTDASDLGRLAELGFEMIPPPRKDARPETGQRSRRDRAAIIRDHLRDVLAETPGVATYHELRRLAILPQLDAQRDFLFMRADARVRADVDAADPSCAARITSTYKRHGLGADKFAFEMNAPFVPDSVGSRRVEMAYDVFIAYATADRAAAETLYRLLASGLRVYFDRASVPPGAAWPREIPDALSASSTIVVLVSSRTDSGWYVSDEVIMAIELHRRAPERHRLVPVRLEAGAPVPYGLLQVQALDLHDVGGLEGVAARLRQLASAQASRAARPEDRGDVTAADAPGPAASGAGGD